MSRKKGDEGRYFLLNKISSRQPYEYNRPLSIVLLMVAVAIPVFGSTAKKSQANCDESKIDSVNTEVGPELTLNPQGIVFEGENIAYRKNRLFVIAKEVPAFCLDVLLKIDSSLLDRNRFCYKSIKAKNDMGYEMYGLGKLNNQRIKNYSAQSISTYSFSGKSEATIAIHQRASYNDSSFTVKIEILSDSSGMSFRSNIYSPLRMTIVKTECKHNVECKLN